MYVLSLNHGALLTMLHRLAAWGQGRMVPVTVFFCVCLLVQASLFLEGMPITLSRMSMPNAIISPHRGLRNH